MKLPVKAHYNKTSGSCTIIAVTHRMSAIHSADKILVLIKGSIIGEGTYQSLYDTNDVFRLLCEREFKIPWGTKENQINCIASRTLLT